jgi:hypothetical protein
VDYASMWTVLTMLLTMMMMIILLELELRWAPRVINCPLTLHDARSLRATNSEHLCFQPPSIVRN